MAITISESAISRSADGNSGEYLYTVAGTEDEAAILNLLISTAPATHLGLVQDDFGIKPLGGGVWDGRVSYVGSQFQKVPPAETGDISISFSTKGGTQKITNSIMTRSRTAASGTAPDFKGAIGITGSGENLRVEGTDIIVPEFSFTYTHYKPLSELTAAFRKTISRLTGRINVAPWKGFAEQEVMFLGIGGSQRNLDDAEIGFDFKVHDNVTDVVIGDITVPEKKGWDYLWLLFEESESEDVAIRKPLAAYVEQVYFTDDFAQLGLGV